MQEPHEGLNTLKFYRERERGCAHLCTSDSAAQMRGGAGTILCLKTSRHVAYTLFPVPQLPGWQRNEKNACLSFITAKRENQKQTKAGGGGGGQS